MNDAPPVIFLMGPTAAGKTALGVALTARFPLEIVSVDSAMVYRGMDIGTGKPPADVLERAPHHLIDLCEPHEAYSAAQFCEDAKRAITAIHRNGKVALLLGGTGLYFRALKQGLSALPKAHPSVRQRIRERAEREGWDALHTRLALVDPDSAARIHPNDPQRIQRALEVYECTGEPMSKLWRHKAGTPLPNPVLVTLTLIPCARATLHMRIERRFLEMLEAGLVREVEGLRARANINSALPSMRSVGYRQVWEYLEQRVSYAQMVQNAVTATRKLAKRQLTWLRAERDATQLDCLSPKLLDSACEHVHEALANIKS